MASVNKVIIVGNLGKDPEVRYNPSGVAWCTVSVATTRSWKDKTSGEKVEETEWHRVVFNGRLAEIVGHDLDRIGAGARFRRCRADQVDFVRGLDRALGRDLDAAGDFAGRRALLGHRRGNGAADIADFADGMFDGADRRDR